MPTSIRQHRDDIENLLDYLLSEGLSVYNRPTSRTENAVAWVPNRSDLQFLGTRDHHSLELYRYWVDSGHFNAVLFDGSLLQLSYAAAGGVLTEHRLAYIPCPVRAESELFVEFPILDVVDGALAGGTESINLATSIRFDFDLANAAPGHPAAHLSLNSSDCRIPCMTPMRVGRFVSFVFEHFYPELWRGHRFLREMPAKEMGSRTVTDEEATGTHLAWSV